MRGRTSNSDGTDEFLMIVCGIAFLIFLAVQGHWFEKGHWQETGRTVPETTTYVPMKVGKDAWLPVPITNPAHPEKVWVPEK